MCQFSDKFYSAVRTLSGDGSIKERLASAYDANLEHIADEDIPDIIRPRFELLKRRMHAVKPAGHESHVVASVRKMSTEQAAGCAALIVAMFSELVRVKSTGERLGLMPHEPAERGADGREAVTIN